MLYVIKSTTQEKFILFERLKTSWNTEYCMSIWIDAKINQLFFLFSVRAEKLFDMEWFRNFFKCIRSHLYFFYKNNTTLLHTAKNISKFTILNCENLNFRLWALFTRMVNKIRFLHFKSIFVQLLLYKAKMIDSFWNNKLYIFLLNFINYYQVGNVNTMLPFSFSTIKIKFGLL